jgi:hypothetical protein
MNWRHDSMNTSTTRYAVTRAEYDRDLARLEEERAELAKHEATLAEIERAYPENTPFSERVRIEYRRRVSTTRGRIASWTDQLSRCDIIDPEPTAPAPAARPTRFPITIARWNSTCGLTGKRIRVNDVITNYRGVWALYDEAVADDDRRRAAGVRRRADRDYAACVLALVGRLPVAA